MVFSQQTAVHSRTTPGVRAGVLPSPHPVSVGFSFGRVGIYGRQASRLVKGSLPRLYESLARALLHVPMSYYVTIRCNCRYTLLKDYLSQRRCVVVLCNYTMCNFMIVVTCYVVMLRITSECSEHILVLGVKELNEKRRSEKRARTFRD